MVRNHPDETVKKGCMLHPFEQSERFLHSESKMGWKKRGFGGGKTPQVAKEPYDMDAQGPAGSFGRPYFGKAASVQKPMGCQLYFR